LPKSAGIRTYRIARNTRTRTIPMAASRIRCSVPLKIRLIPQSAGAGLQPFGGGSVTKSGKDGSCSASRGSLKASGKCVVCAESRENTLRACVDVRRVEIANANFELTKALPERAGLLCLRVFLFKSPPGYHPSARAQQQTRFQLLAVVLGERKLRPVVQHHLIIAAEPGLEFLDAVQVHNG
jgi:hypothetical protein